MRKMLVGKSLRWPSPPLFWTPMGSMFLREDGAGLWSQKKEAESSFIQQRRGINFPPRACLHST